MTIDVGALRRQVQELARAQARLEKQVTTLAIAPRAGYTSIDAGALTVTDDTGAPRVVLGAQADGSYAVTAVGATAPVAPSAPVLGAQPGAVSITWDGTTDDESGWLADWSHVEAHVAGAAGFEATAENQVGTFTSRSGGTIMVGRPAGPVWVKLTAVNSSGAVSPASAETTIVVPDVPEPSGSDGNAPATSPAPTIIPGIGTLFVKWDPVTNNDPVTYAVHAVAGADEFTADASNLIGVASGTLLVLRALADDTPLVQGSSYAVKIVASDVDGPAPASAVTVGTPAQVTGPDIAVGALTADMLLANDALLGALQAQTITGVEIEGGEFRTDAGANHIYIGRHPSGSQVPIGVVQFHSEHLDSAAQIQATSTGTLYVSSGWDYDPNSENQAHQSGTLGLTGVGPYQNYSDASLDATATHIFGGRGGSYTPEVNGILLRADNRLLMEAGSRVEIEAPIIALTGNVHVNGEDLNSPPFGYFDFGNNAYVAGSFLYPSGTANSGSFFRGGVELVGAGVRHSTTGTSLVDTGYGLRVPKAGIYNVFAHVFFRAGTAAATTTARRGVQVLRNGTTSALAESVVAWGNNTAGRMVVDGWVKLDEGDVLQMRYFTDVANHNGGIDYARVGMKFSQP